MTYYDLVFKLQHECPYSEFSRTHPSTVVSHWCNWSRDVLEFRTTGKREPNLLRATRALLDRLGAGTIRTAVAGANVRVLLRHCSCDQLPPPTLPSIEERNCLNLQPMIYSSGWEWYRIAAFSAKDVKRLFADLERTAKVELISRRTIPEAAIHESLMVSTASILGGLTDRQAHALVVALDHGYYTVPRAATALKIAERIGIARTSYVDHLRKGENKLIQSVAPYLRMRIPPDRGS